MIGRATCRPEEIDVAESIQYSLKFESGESAATLLVRRWPGAGEPVLYVHGATFPSALSVGYRLAGRSWADQLHASGFDVWAFDFIGFGGSTRPAAMNGPAAGVLPIGRAPLHRPFPLCVAERFCLA